MGRFLNFLLTTLVTVFVLCFSSSASGRSSLSSDAYSINRRNITEGGNLLVKCNVSVDPQRGQIIWSGPRLTTFGPLLNITNVTRNNLGLYTCNAYNYTAMESRGEDDIGKEIYMFFLSVLYPAKILRLNVSKTELHQGGDFNMQVQVEGNPEPTTTFRSLLGEHVWFQKKGEGNFSITIPFLNCTDTGQYELSCENSLATDFVEENIVVLCPPEPVTNLTVYDIKTGSANLSFITGNDNNDTQTFYVMREVDGNFTDFHRKKKDSPNDTGGKHVSFTISTLNESTLYSLTVLSGNSRGNSTHANTVQFTTYGKPKPDPKFHVNTTFKPRLGDTVTLTAHAQGFPMPTFQWRHYSIPIQSTDENYTSSVFITAIAVDNFGNYTLEMTNEYGKYLKDYEVLADGPPEPISYLSVSEVNTTCAHLHFTTGYNYNSTQTFIIEQYEDKKITELSRCKDLTSGRGGDKFTCELCELKADTLYNVTVVSQNARGESQGVPDFVKFSTYGEPKPDPEHASNTTFKPRLGDTVSLTIQAVGYPPPKYVWLRNGKQINSSDTNYTSTVYLANIAVDDFGKYTLNMSNEVGYFVTVFDLLAEGPPEPISDLGVSDVNTTCAHLHFTTGYNYNSTQTFIIEQYKGDNITELKQCKDLTSGRGGDKFTCELCELEADTLYNATVVSQNARGESQGVPDSVKFSTYGKPKPDPEHASNTTFKPRLGDTVSLTIQAVGYPHPHFRWLRNGKQINSSDTNYTSTVYLANIAVDDFGKYTLNMSNEVGYFATVYELLAEGPPNPVTNLNVSTVKTTTANLSFITGYDYNKTQTFVVLRYQNGNYTELGRVNDTHPDPGQQEFSFVVNKLSTNTEYNISVVSMNSDGISPPAKSFVSFLTEGVPEPDPAMPNINKTTPRLGDNTTFKVEAIGNPAPVFSWWHNNVPVKHTDHDLTTMIEILNVNEDDFGAYFLNMKNEIGSKNYTFTVLGDGPPEAVTELSSSDITADSVELKWNAGFDYGSKQSFEVKGTVNDKELINIKDVDDKTRGKGGSESFKLENLEGSSNYDIYLVAKNARGKAAKSNTVAFTTQAKKGKGTTTAEYVGYVMGGIGSIVFIIALISVVRWCSKRRSGVPYEELPEHTERDVQQKPHHYRYDDAAAPSGL